MSQQEDFCRLMKQAQAGGQEELERLMQMYQAIVSNETRRFVDSLNPDVSVQDIQQETWIRVWSRLPGFVGADNDEACKKMFASWLKITTRRVALGVINAGQTIMRGGDEKTVSLDVPIRDRNKSASSILRADEERTQLHEALTELDNSEEAEIVKLHHLDGLSVAEIAAQKKLSEDQVRYRLKLALKKLGRRLDSE